MGATLDGARGPSGEVMVPGDPEMPPAVPATQGPRLEHKPACAEDLVVPAWPGLSAVSAAPRQPECPVIPTAHLVTLEGTQ